MQETRATRWGFSRHSISTSGFLADTRSFPIESLSFNIGQDINLSGFAFNYRIGVIAGLNYSLYSDELHFSFSPNILLEIGYAIQDFSLLLYATGERFYETTFQSVPIIGLKTEIGFSDQRICLDCYVKLADYMEGPTILLSDIAMRVSYEVEL